MSPNICLTDNERALCEFLAESPKQHRQIVTFLESLKVSESTANTMLNRMTDNYQIFRIEREGAVFYRVNDFPVETQRLIAAFNILIAEEKDMEAKELLEKIRTGVLSSDSTDHVQNVMGLMLLKHYLKLQEP